MACQDYFTHFEPSQSLGGAKTGAPRQKKQTDIPQCHVMRRLIYEPQQDPAQGLQAKPVEDFKYFITDYSKVVLLLWFIIIFFICLFFHLFLTFYSLCLG